MQKTGFTEALDQIVAEDSRYDREAYLFLREALDFTTRQRRKHRDEEPQHVSGQELLAGIRKYALKEFGPMAITVFSYWGIRRCEDFGEMVYNLIRAAQFGKTPTDSIEDFGGGYDFVEAFVAPFRPAPASPVKENSAAAPGKRLPRRNSERNPDGEVRK